MRIERIKIRNFKALRDVTLKDIPPFVVIVGENGVGKTTLFDVFGFLRDCLKDNVRAAVQRRGGFRELVTRGHLDEQIEIELKLRMKLAIGERTVTYLIKIGLENGQPVIFDEVLRYTRFGAGKPFDFIRFKKGAGSAITNESDLDRGGEEKREEQKLDSPDILAIKGLGQFQRFEAASSFRNLIENWHVSDFHISSARTSQDAGFAEHLSMQGENLPLVAQYLYLNYRNVFDEVLRKMARRVPGIESVEATETQDGRIILRFKDGSFLDPFVSRFVSDGTIKMFAYLLLLHDPNPHLLLCVEEPENQLYPSLLGNLAEEFIDYSQKGGQVFVSTHSPDFLDAVPLDAIFILSKEDGITSVTRAEDDSNIKALIEAGDLPGELWRQKLLRPQRSL
ncbi:MAG: AAA family ATPase [Bosea sp. (in: a-proteobacteria)]